MSLLQTPRVARTAVANAAKRLVKHQRASRAAFQSMAASQKDQQHQYEQQEQPQRREFIAGRDPQRVQNAQNVNVGILKQAQRGIALSGVTLDASLKMHCETAGADYAIYWTKTGDKFAAAGHSITDVYRDYLQMMDEVSSYAEASADFITPDARGSGPVTTAYHNYEQLFVVDAAAHLTASRKEIADEFGIVSSCFVPFSGGVLEYGTSIMGNRWKDWNEMPACPNIPKVEIQQAFETKGSNYVIFWAENDGSYEVIADFVKPEHKAIWQEKSGDDSTFTSATREWALLTNGDDEVFLAANTGRDIKIAESSTDASFKRRELSNEFGIGTIHFKPVQGGVLEYGLPHEE